MELITIEPLLGQKTLAGEDLLTIEEGLGTVLIRTQLHNRNRRVRRRALKARIKCEVQAMLEREATSLPRELTCVYCKTSKSHAKRKASCKPVCNDNPSREATAFGFKTRKINTTCVKREVTL